MISLLLFACVLTFQEEQVPYIEEFKVQYVSLDVAAFDKNGNPVTDLKPTDFVVKENKKKIKPDSFRILDYDKQSSVTLNIDTLKPIVPSSADQANQPELVSQFILVLDFESANLMEIQRTFTELERFLDSFEPERKIRLMVYSMAHGGLSERFHDNIDDVRRVLEGYKTRFLGEKKGQTTIGSSGTFVGDNNKGILEQQNTNYGKLNRDIDELERKLRVCRTIHPPARSGDRFELQKCIDAEVEVYMDLQEDRVRRAIGELEALVEAFPQTGGLKTMLFVSPGFSINPGQAGLTLAEHYRHFARSELDIVNSQSPGNPEAQAMLGELNSLSVLKPKSYEDEFRAVVHACTRNRVVFHTFDLFNFQRERNRQDDLFHQSGKPVKLLANAHRQYGVEMQEGLTRLAEDSGGRFAAGISLGGPLKSILNERQFIYVLGYESPQGKPGKYRKIKIKCKRRGVTLRYRKGYIGS